MSAKYCDPYIYEPIEIDEETVRLRRNGQLDTGSKPRYCYQHNMTDAVQGVYSIYIVAFTSSSTTKSDPYPILYYSRTLGDKQQDTVLSPS